MNLDFLRQVTTSVAPEKPAPKRSVAKKQRQPESGLTIRLFKDGSVYPSQELVDSFGLEYSARDEHNKPTGFGLDVIDSRDMASQITTEQPFVGIAVVPRVQGKTDLFRSCEYNADGSPASTVAIQGASTYGKSELIPTLQSVYGEDIVFNAEGFIDLTVLADIGITSPDNRFFIFKKVSRGANIGKKDYVIRDGIIIMPLVPAIDVDEGTIEDPEASAALAEVATKRKSEKTSRKAKTTEPDDDEDDDFDPVLEDSI